MPSFTPTDEQQQLIDTIKRFAKDDIQPMAHEADENERIPTNIIKTGWGMARIRHRTIRVTTGDRLTR